MTKREKVKKLQALCNAEKMLDVQMEALRRNCEPIWDQLSMEARSGGGPPSLDEVMGKLRHISMETATKVFEQETPEDDLDYLISVYENNPRLVELASKQHHISQLANLTAEAACQEYMDTIL